MGILDLFGWTPGPRLVKALPYVAGGIIGVGIVVGIGASGFMLARGHYLPRAELAEQKLSTFTETQKALASAGKLEAQRQADEAERNQKARQNAVLAAIQDGTKSLAVQLTATNRAIQESLNAPQYDCLRIPLPDDTLRMLARPGGNSIAP